MSITHVNGREVPIPHVFICRLEHAIVREIRHLYSAPEEEKARIDANLEVLAREYWQRTGRCYRHRYGEVPRGSLAN